MPSGLTQRLISVLQLARLALVFTAVADGVASLLLLTTLRPLDGGPLTAWRVVAAALMSVGLYGFGMTLNDIIDRRRDEQLVDNLLVEPRRDDGHARVGEELRYLRLGTFSTHRPVRITGN